jgi:predicted ester cyclase
VVNEDSKTLVKALVEAVNARDEAALAEITADRFAGAARRWIAPFEAAFPDFQMRLVEAVSEGSTVVAHLKCSGTHLGDWLGIAATGRPFQEVDEIYVFRIESGRIIDGFGVEDNLSRMRQLGLAVTAPAHR